MSRMKDAYLKEFERIENEKLDKGMLPAQAFAEAAAEAHRALSDRLADKADDLRLRKKEGGY